MIRSLPRGADVVEIGLHEQLAGQAFRRGRKREAHVLDVEAGSEPERAHEDRLAHSMDLAQGSPVRISRDDLLAVDLGMQDLVDDAEECCGNRPRSPCPSTARRTSGSSTIRPPARWAS